MKNVLTIIVFLVSWASAYGQVDYEAIDLRINNSYQYVSTFSSPAKKKYTNAMRWLGLSVDNFNKSIITEDAQAFSVVFKPEILYDQTDAKSDYLVASISVDCRDEKFRVKLMEINRKTVTKTCNYLSSPNKIYKTRNYNAETELKQFDQYKDLSSRTDLTSDEERVLKDLKRYAKLTKEEIIAKEMKPYIDLQKAIAKLIEGIEKAIKEQ